MSSCYVCLGVVLLLRVPDPTRHPEQFKARKPKRPKPQHERAVVSVSCDRGADRKHIHDAARVDARSHFDVHDAVRDDDGTLIACSRKWVLHSLPPRRRIVLAAKNYERAVFAMALVLVLVRVYQYLVQRLLSVHMCV